MKLRFLPGFSIIVLLFVTAYPALAATNPAASPATNPASNLDELSRRAVSASAAESEAGIAELRAAGPAGLRALIESNAAEIERHITNPLAPSTLEWQRLAAALDAVSQQKDSYLSGLYWYTDLSQAKAAAAASGKPIVSLRLLGKLSEEYSCANSRFFRTVLYASPEVARYLNDHFVLHWESVRPVPRVTIDFGDGRKLERTVTGNSIHYILDPQGRPIDALPGLYGPRAFLDRLTRVQQFFSGLPQLEGDARIKTLYDYRHTTLKSITDQWVADAVSVGGKVPAYLVPENARKYCQAVEIAPLAMTKRATEITILRAITRDTDALGSVTDADTWTKIAARHTTEARLDQRSIGLMLR